MTPEKPKENGEAAAQGVGEPWHYVGTARDGEDDSHVYDRRQRYVAEFRGEGGDEVRRAISCVNSLAGIADPDAFVKAADAMDALLEQIAIGMAIGRGGPYPIGARLHAYRTARGPREAASHEKGAA